MRSRKRCSTAGWAESVGRIVDRREQDARVGPRPSHRVEQELVRVSHITRDGLEQREARPVRERAEEIVAAHGDRHERARLALLELRQLLTEHVADRRAVGREVVQRDPRKVRGEIGTLLLGPARVVVAVEQRRGAERCDRARVRNALQRDRDIHLSRVERGVEVDRHGVAERDVRGE